MPGLEDQIEESAGSGTWVESAARFTNSPGTPLVSATANDSGEAIADVYSLSFANVVAETDADVTVETSSPSNPYKGRVVTGVLLDGATGYDNVIPGVTLVFSDSASFANTWEAEVRAGRYAGAFPAFGSEAGTPGTGRRHRVENTGAATAQGCVAELVNITKLVRKVGQIFEFIRPFAEDATEKLSGEQVVPYAITVENKAGSGASITADIKVDGALVNVKNLATLATGTSEDVNVVDEYEITSGGLTGVRFMLSQQILNTATANILIFENSQTQIAPDVSGAAGTYGTTPVDLTESGEPTGEITAGGFAFYWERTLVNEGDGASSNPKPGDVRLSGEVGEAAGWTD